MERKRFWEQTWLGLRALAVITVTLLTTMTAWAEEITINLGEGRGTAIFSEASLVFSKCEALEVGYSFDIPLEVMTRSKAYGGVVMQNYTATLDNGVTVDGTLTGEIVAASSQTYTYTVTKNEMTRRPVGVSTARTRTTDSGSAEIATWSGFRKGAASFTFDDGAPSHVSDAGPLFKQYGYKATFNLVYNWNPNWSGFQGLADEGHEIASHSNSHGNNMSGEEASSKNNIKGKINQKYGVITVAYPNCNVPNESAVLQNYIVGRICNGSWQGMSDNMGKDGPSNWAKTPAIMTGAEGQIKSTNDFTSQMQKVIQSNGWVAFLTHGFQGKNNGSATYSPTDINAIKGALNWAQQNDKDIWVAPMGHVAMYIKERKASNIEPQDGGAANTMSFKLTHTIADNVSKYDYPLSIRVRSDWTMVEVTQGDTELESKIDGGYIYFDAIPNGGTIIVKNTSSPPPYFVDLDNINLSVPENTPKAKAGQIKGKDDENDSFTFDITGGTAQDLFDIGLTTGNVTMKNGVEPFDYEAWKELDTKYVIVVDLCDKRATTFNTNLCSQAKFEVSVTDVNEKPYFTNQSDVISIAEGAAVSTDAITYADPDKYTEEFLNNELVIIGGDSELFELTSDGNIKPKEGAVIDKGEHKIEVRVRDANKDGDENYVYPDLYNDKTFKIRYYVTGVDYLDWDDTERMFVKKNTATDDNDANDKVYVLQGTETTLGQVGNETWYVCNTPATDTYPDGLVYQDQVAFSGNVHLILVDGCKMTVGNAFSSIGSSAIAPAIADLTIYGQTDGSGTLAAYGMYQGIYSFGGSLTINGGNIYARGVDNGIYLQSSTLTINGGQVNAIADNNNGINSDKNDITINGGKVQAVGGNEGIKKNSGKIILGWRNPDDYIFANTYNCGTGSLMTAAGQRFLAYSPKISYGNPGFDLADTENEASYVVGEANTTAATAIGSGISLIDPSSSYTIAGKTLRPLASVESDGNGGTTCSPGYLLGIEPDGITPVGKAEPDVKIGSTPYYIYKAGSENETVALSVPNFGQKGAEFSETVDDAAITDPADAAVTVADGAATAALPWTGAHDVFITGARYYDTDVSYLEWSDTDKKLVSKNTEDLSNTATKVYILTGGDATTLPGGWYVAKDWNTNSSVNGGTDALYTGTLKFTGDTHIILADGANMSIGTEQSPIVGNGIEVVNASLAIYAQSTEDDKGKLDILTPKNYRSINIFSTDTDTGITINGGDITCVTDSKDCIHVESTNGATSVTINGGDVNCTTTYSAGIYADSSTGASSVTINGGNVNCTATYSAGILAYSSDGASSVTISGGDVDCTVSDGYGIYAESPTCASSVTIDGGTITVGDTDTDYGIFVYSGATSSVTINDGKVDLNVSETAITVWSRSTTDDAAVISIKGGKVSAKGSTGFYVYNNDNKGNVYLGWKNVDDYIITNNFDVDGGVNIVSGQYLIACDAIDGSGDALSGTLTDTEIAAIKGKYLKPAQPLPAGQKYIAYSSDEGNWKVSDADVQVYVVTGYNLATGEVSVIPIDGNEIPKGVAVIIGNKTDGNALPANLMLQGEQQLSDGAAGSISGGTLANFFVCDGTTTVGALLAAVLGGTADLSDYVLFMLSGDGIFKPVSATATSTPAKGACVLAVSKVDILTKGSLSVGGTSNARSIAIALGGETTGIEEMAQGDMQNAPSDGSWYDLQGRRLDQAPKAKGVYIRNGILVVIK